MFFFYAFWIGEFPTPRKFHLHSTHLNIFKTLGVSFNFLGLKTSSYPSTLNHLGYIKQQIVVSVLCNDLNSHRGRSRLNRSTSRLNKHWYAYCRQACKTGWNSQNIVTVAIYRRVACNSCELWRLSPRGRRDDNIDSSSPLSVFILRQKWVRESKHPVEVFLHKSAHFLRLYEVVVYSCSTQAVSSEEDSLPDLFPKPSPSSIGIQHGTIVDLVRLLISVAYAIILG